MPKQPLSFTGTKIHALGVRTQARVWTGATLSKIISAAILTITLAAGSANAANFSFTGNFNHVDEVQEFDFSTAAAASDVTLRTWSFAGGTNATGTSIASGDFDPIVTLFNASTGAFITQNDDGGPSLLDSFLTSNLPAGDYTATITQYSSFANGPVLADGFRGSGDDNFSPRDSHWAVDVMNVNAASIGTSYISHTGTIPEPETYALLLAGLFSLLSWRGGARRMEGS